MLIQGCGKMTIHLLTCLWEEKRLQATSQPCSMPNVPWSTLGLMNTRMPHGVLTQLREGAQCCTGRENEVCAYLRGLAARDQRTSRSDCFMAIRQRHRTPRLTTTVTYHNNFMAHPRSHGPSKICIHWTRKLTLKLLNKCLATG